MANIMTDKKSSLVVEFGDINSVEFSMNLNNVSPMQLLALSQYLDWKAKTALAQQEYMEMQKHEASKIAVPTPPEIILGKK